MRRSIEWQMKKRREVLLQVVVCDNFRFMEGVERRD